MPKLDQRLTPQFRR